MIIWLITFIPKYPFISTWLSIYSEKYLQPSPIQYHWSLYIETTRVTSQQDLVMWMYQLSEMPTLTIYASPDHLWHLMASELASSYSVYHTWRYYTRLVRKCGTPRTSSVPGFRGLDFPQSSTEVSYFNSRKHFIGGTFSFCSFSLVGALLELLNERSKF